MTIRTRVFQDKSDVYPYHHWEVNQQTGLRTDVANFQAEKTTYEYMRDTVTPGFHELMAKGNIINSSMLRQLIEYKCGQGSYHATKAGSNVRYEGDGCVTAWGRSLNGGVPGTDYSTELFNANVDVTEKAKFIALSKVEKPHYEFGEDFRERAKTLETLRKPTAQLRSMGDKFERDFLSRMSLHTKNRRTRLRVRDKAKLLAAASDVFADVWLTARFGYGNILQSVFRSLDSMLDNVPPASRHTVRGFATGKVFKDEEIQCPHSYGTDIFYRDFSMISDVRSYIMYEVSHPLDGFAKKHGLLLQDVPKAMWQTCPSSWVIDQFFNVSGAIQGFMGLYNPKVKVLAAGWSWETNQWDIVSWRSQTRNDGWQVSIQPDEDSSHVIVRGRNIWNPSILDLVPPFQPDGLVTGPSTKIITNIAYGMKKLSLSSLLRKL